MRSRGYLVAFLLVGACSIDAPKVEGESSTEQDALRFGLHHKVRICHATGSPTRPFVLISVSHHGLKGHRHHRKDIIPAPPQGCPGDTPPPSCMPGASRPCYEGPAGTEGIGTCAEGTQICNAAGSGFGPCEGSITPTADVCGDGLDNDCDGTPDDACVCAPGSAATCYEGPAGTAGIGTCIAGTQICNAAGSGFGPCEGSITPTADVCGDGLDSDCDGIADDGCVCVPGTAAPCYDGPAGTAGVGTCAAGTQTCNADGGAYGPCVGAVFPAADVCIDGLDNDCDGTADDGCVCAPGSSAACYDGPAGTAGVGTCAAGTHVCNADGSGFGACTGEVTPTADICIDGLDNDCDGTADEDCVCAPGSVSSCYGGPPGTQGVGTCVAGTRVCNVLGSGFGPCVGAVLPTPDFCGDGLDNDCDAIVDDGCFCAPGAAAACYDGPPGTEGVGVCRAGTHICNAEGSAFGPCVGAITPTPEVCGDGLDNDCDGAVDGSIQCQPEVCNNGVDDNLDGFVDCADPVCATAAICTTEASCGNGVDDDGDGLTDCAEPGCATNAACLTAVERFCNDGVDNDGDGLTDAAEAACGWAVATLPCPPGKLQAYRFTGPIVLADPGLTPNVNLVAAGPGTVGTVAVRVSITHTFDADLDISLASALNTTIDLSSDNGATGDNFQGTVFVDSAPVSIIAGAPPFAGSFRPEVALSALAGQTVAGTWRGLINDDTAGFQGTLTEYALAICIQ
jgi:subtilisin-like proprotein convertase family protein